MGLDNTPIVEALCLCPHCGFLEVFMKTKQSENSDIVYVKVRIERGLHEKLKQIAQKEKRSMNFMLNNSVELLVSVKSREF